MSRRSSKAGELVEIFTDGYGNISVGRRPTPKHTWPTGWGDELAYHDEDGLTRHIPARTKYSHPYTYDPIVLINTGTKATGGAYSDRMLQWDYDKFRNEMGKLNDSKGELIFRWSDKALVEKFCQRYFNDKSLKVTRVVEECNHSSGYPLWYIGWTSKKDAEVKALYDACKGTDSRPDQAELEAIDVKYQLYTPEPKKTA